ncbi:hypothetical protein [Herbidospora yilanensis]|uniref:hypothetical protein n=1 Tax=Herbidospora yilanensis TaxID=354426 RepID=UPI000782AB6F|nr:hypothetical protein [Herbidospora yilanensis]
MRKGIAALAGLLFAAVTPAAALASEDPGSMGVSIRVLPPDGPVDPVDPVDPVNPAHPAHPVDPSAEEPDGHRGRPMTHHVDDGHRGGVDGIQGNVDGQNFEGGSDNSDINRDSTIHRDSGVQGSSEANRESGARPEELPFTGMNGDALLVLALAGAVASLEGAALIVLTRRRFRRSP